MKNMCQRIVSLPSVPFLRPKKKSKSQAFNSRAIFGKLSLNTMNRSSVADPGIGRGGGTGEGVARGGAK